MINDTYICTNCNETIKKNSKYCISCGAKLDWLEANKLKNHSKERIIIAKKEDNFVFECGKCFEKVIIGEKHCNSCGTSLEWPIDILGKTRKRKIILPINPKKLRYLMPEYEGRIHLIIVLIKLVLYLFAPILHLKSIGAIDVYRSEILQTIIDCKDKNYRNTKIIDLVNGMKKEIKWTKNITIGISCFYLLWFFVGLLSGVSGIEIAIMILTILVINTPVYISLLVVNSFLNSILNEAEWGKYKYDLIMSLGKDGKKQIALCQSSEN